MEVVGLPCVWVMKILLILPILTLLFCNRCCVASPQSKSHTSPFRRNARAEWFRVEDGCADALPRTVMLTVDNDFADTVLDLGGILQRYDELAALSEFCVPRNS